MRLSSSQIGIAEAASLHGVSRFVVWGLLVGCVAYGWSPLRIAGMPHLLAGAFVLVGLGHTVASGRLDDIGQRALVLIAYLGLAVVAVSLRASNPPLALLLGSYTVIGIGAAVVVYSLAARRLGPHRWTPIDSAMVALLTLISCQLAIAEMMSGLEHETGLGWGRSNYVSASTLPIVLYIWPRRHDLPDMRRRLLEGLLGIALTLSVLLQSRGSLAALGVGVLAAQLLSRRLSIGARLALGLATLGAGIYTYQWLLRERLATDSASHLNDNVQSRYQVWSVALREFRRSPFFGTGPGGLRSVTSAEIEGGSLTHAHNVWLSYLQQFGLMAIPLLGVLAYVLVYGFRHLQGAERSSIVFIGVVTFIEPLFEGLVGAFVATLILLASLAGVRERKELNRKRLPRDHSVGSSSVNDRMWVRS